MDVYNFSLEKVKQNKKQALMSFWGIPNKQARK